MKLFAVITAILAMTPARAQRLVFSSDTIVSKEYQEFFCLGVDSLAHVCTDTLVITAEGGYVYIDSIVYRVDTNRVIATSLELGHNFDANNYLSGSYFSRYHAQFNYDIKYEPVGYGISRLMWIVFVGNMDNPYDFEYDPRPESGRQIEIQLCFFYTLRQDSIRTDTISIIGREWANDVQIRGKGLVIQKEQASKVQAYKLNGQHFKIIPPSIRNRLPRVIRVRED